MTNLLSQLSKHHRNEYTAVVTSNESRKRDSSKDASASVDDDTAVVVAWNGLLSA